MSIFLRRKKFGTLLTSSLLLLLSSCMEQNVSTEKINESADRTETSVNEMIKRENDRLIKDKPDEEDTEENSKETENTVEVI